jgi:hypothetical protein
MAGSPSRVVADTGVLVATSRLASPTGAARKTPWAACIDGTWSSSEAVYTDAAGSTPAPGGGEAG